MNEITEYIALIFQYSDSSGLLWLVAFICIIILILLTWLILRRFRLWYWKVDLQINTLKNIDNKLKYLEEGIKENVVFVNENNEVESETAAEIEVAAAESAAEIETEAAEAAATAETTAEPAEATTAEAAATAEPAAIIAEAEATTETITAAETVQENEIETEAEAQEIKQMEMVYGKSKTGRIYTEAELEELIRD